MSDPEKRCDSLVVVVVGADVSLRRSKLDGVKWRGECLGALTVAVPMLRSAPPSVYQFPSAMDFYRYRLKVTRGKVDPKAPYKVDRYNINIGYSRAERVEYWRMFKAGRLLGRLVEIHYQGLNEAGRLLFPIHIQMIPLAPRKS